MVHVMLKIERSVRGAAVVFVLSGEIGRAEVEELERVLASEPHDDKVLDMKDVTLVHRDTLVFLADCQAAGTALENCPSYIREWIARERDPD